MSSRGSTVRVSKIRASVKLKVKKRAKRARVLKSKESFGGGLILIGADQVQTEIIPRPDILNTLSTNRILSINLEPRPTDIRKNRRPSSTPTEDSEVTESTTVDSKRFHKKSSLKSDITEKSVVSFGPVQEDPCSIKKCEKVTFPKIQPTPCNQYCISNLVSNMEPSKQALDSRMCNSKKDWMLGMPSSINSLPINAVRVRWKLSPHVPCYTLEMVHAVLSRHGRIDSMRQHTPNSAVVVFADVQTARRCIKCAKTGVCPLICTWWFPQMYNYQRMLLEQSAREEKKYPIHLTETTILNLQFLLAQKKCEIQRKSYAGMLSYNTETFIP